MELEALVFWYSVKGKGIRELTLEEREMVMMVEQTDLLDDDAHAGYQPMHLQYMYSAMGTVPARLFHEDLMILRYMKYFRIFIHVNSREKTFYNFFNHVVKN